MTQYEYQVICDVIRSGAPALANNLIGKLNDLIAENVQLKSEKDNKAVDKKVKE